MIKIEDRVNDVNEKLKNIKSIGDVLSAEVTKDLSNAYSEILSVANDLIQENLN